MPTIRMEDRLRWTKRAKADSQTRTASRYPFRVKLYSPSDGSGCLPAGEQLTHTTRYRSTLLKAVNEAIVYCDERNIRITFFPFGFGY